MAYAQATDLENRWRVLTDSEKSVVETFLNDAENMLKCLIDDYDEKVEDDTFKAVLIAVECAMVKRALMSNLDLIGVSQHTMTAGSYNENVTYANPSGDMYLTKNEKKLLGISRLLVGAIKPYVGCLDTEGQDD
jgi:hypothetical protein